MAKGKDGIVPMPDGFYARVDGKLHGPWQIRGYAVAGLATEQARAKARKEAEAMEKAAALNAFMSAVACDE